MRVAVMISGRGSNMEALIAAAKQPQSPFEVVLVLADGTAQGLEIAEGYGIKTACLAEESGREVFETASIKAIIEAKIDLICLAGFMRILSPDFCGRFHGRLINIHPSLLPRHKGLNTHQRAIDAGDTTHGCSVHFVTADVDGGAIIAQSAITITPTDTSQSLGKRVLAEEHRLYPLVVTALAKGLVCLDDGKAQYRADNQKLGFSRVEL